MNILKTANRIFSKGAAAAGILFLCLLAAGCSPVVKINLTEAGSSENMTVLFESHTGDTIADVFYTTTNAPAEMTAADEALMSDGLTKAGFTVNSCTGYGVSIDCSTGPDNVADILPDVPDMFQVTESKGTKKFSIKLTPDYIQTLLTYLPEDSTGYADLLMAPLFTGEEMDSDEYVDTVAIVYGRKLARETETFRFTFDIEVPGDIVSLAVPKYAEGSFKANKAEITATMADFLSDYHTAIYSVEWK